MKTSDFKKIRWKLYPKNPVLESPPFTPLIADPSLLLDTESPDGKFHLFCHTLFGIHRYESEDGFRWDSGRLLFRHTMRPFIYKENNIFYLLYERYTPFQIVLSWFTFWKWDSHIEIRTSKDLKNWSSAKKILEPSLDWHINARYGKSIGNPCLVKIEDKYRLYYSASLSFIPDCGFCEPTYIGVAESDKILGPYKSLKDPLISPDTYNRNLAAGSIKVLKTENGFVGFENCIYQDSNGRSGSSIYLLNSFDGIKWDFLFQKPILSPSSDWMKSHIYAMDIKFHPIIKKWFLYFNARNDWHWSKGKEKIGLLIGEIEQPF
ncbi:glycosyl hydrolase, family 43 domain protein [Leptospira noguchii str. 1993005606]|uniref:Glycosyl hydrolase, family 43 domain protein n=1 Tax=Leptospira noguchii str. 2007001578 TaxID=1049974 RepID=A0ABP2T9B5_9LEPT|nr:family 43 glycosylhydrolase [Leptospira noguchii]EMN00690.1 glycosyl hydrolase, family 43 domain protein [Leptospira noguchii str. 2007001578]EPE82076.1 glycosyl hydrolase, family 43 domain protein [Leptospira noguchii str. 1993005606]